jgi:hypothetical protein
MKMERQSVCAGMGDKPIVRFKFAAAKKMANYLTAEDADVDGWEFQVIQGGPSYYYIRVVDPGDLDIHHSPYVVGWL